MIDLNCIECERRRAELTGQLELLISKTKERVIQEQITYGIYLDLEDRKLGVLPLTDCYARGYKPIEIISKYQ